MCAAPAVALCGITLSTGCVSADAGYEDVREITSARLGRDVHWHAQDSGKSGDAEIERLLSERLTPALAVAIALHNNAALQAAFEDLGVARGRLLHALRLPNPEVGAALRYGAAERPEIDLDATLSLSELLVLPWRSGVGQAELDAKAIEVTAKVFELVFETYRAFYAFQGQAQELELQERVLASLRAAVDMAERLHEAGNITELRLASERAFYEEARIEYVRAEAALEAAREKLNQLMGLSGPNGARWTAETVLPVPTPVEPLIEDLEARVVEKSLDLLLCRRRFAQAARRANLSRFEGWVPDLRAGVSAERHDTEWSVGPLAELEVPLFYQGQGETAAALSEMRRERKLLLDTAVRLRARARATASELSVVSKSLEYQKTVLLPLRDKVLEEATLHYNAMSIGVFELLQAKRDQLAAAQSHIRLLHDYWMLRTDVDELLAGRLPGTPGRASARAMDAAAPNRADAH